MSLSMPMPTWLAISLLIFLGFIIGLIFCHILKVD